MDAVVDENVVAGETALPATGDAEGIRLPEKSTLRDFIDGPVEELVSLPKAEPISPAMQERHAIYARMLMALVSHYWNGNKRGRTGTYPWRDGQKDPSGVGYLGGDYRGHNIAAIAVDGDGEIIDFEFNHNDTYNSSAEHAEARLVRRVFNLTQIQDNWNTGQPAPRTDYGNIMKHVTVYTSLESCAQCAGIMALGQLKELIYLQTDPGQFLIGNILYNLTRGRTTPGTKRGAPLPISGKEIGLDHFDRLNEAYEYYAKTVSEKNPFYQPESTLNEKGEVVEGKPDPSSSMTSFLCIDLARDIFKAGADEFAALAGDKLHYPDFTPEIEENKRAALNNEAVLEHTKKFLTYATTTARRGTPHKV